MSTTMHPEFMPTVMDIHIMHAAIASAETAERRQAAEAATEIGADTADAEEQMRLDGGWLGPVMAMGVLALVGLATLAAMVLGA